MKQILSFFVVCSFLILSLTPSLSGAQTQTPEEPHVAVRIIPEKTHVKPGEMIDLVIEQKIDPGWHTYWVNPGDSGERMQIDWTLPEGFETGDMLWPVPKKISFGEFISYGYEDTARIVQPLFVPDQLPEGPVRLKADIQLLVCADICIPEFSEVEVVLNEGLQADHSGFLHQAYQDLPAYMALPAHYSEGQSEGENNLILTFERLPEEVIIQQAPKPDYQLLPYEWGLIDDHVSSTGEKKGARVTIYHKRGDRPLSAFKTVSGLLSYLDKAGKRQAVTFEATQVPDAVLAEKTAPVSQPEPGDMQAEAKENLPAPAMPDKQINIAKAIFFALLGGLILNLMPCVFPVLSLKALKLSRLSEKELKEARWDSAFYTAGIVLSFIFFAVILLSFRMVGEQAGWGFQLQNPGFVLFLSWLLFAIGLNLSGFYEIGAGVAGKGQGLLGRFSRGHSASFVTGILAALVATPCIAPFMGVALGFAVTQPAPAMFSVFIALGLGLALPYIILASFPRLRSVMPQPGEWMETFRQLLAFPMYGAAIWLVWVVTMQGGAPHLVIALSGALGFVFAIWLWQKAQKQKKGGTALKLIAVVIFTLMAVMLIYLSQSPAEKSATQDLAARPALQEGAGWLDYDAHSFLALEAGDKPLFVNMTAAWCLTCKINERIALDTERTREAFARYNVQPVKGDWTNYNEEITAYLEQFERNGVPLYVYYPPRNPQTGERPAPKILPQLLTPGIIAAVIEESS